MSEPLNRGEGAPDHPFALLERCMLADRYRLLRDLRRLKPRPTTVDALPEALRTRLDRSLARFAERAASLPAPSFPGFAGQRAPRRDCRGDPKAPVIIVGGETGSGKTTQLPKICGAGPRRGRPDRPHPAAPDCPRATADRIAEELGSPLGWCSRGLARSALPTASGRAATSS